MVRKTQLSETELKDIAELAHLCEQHDDGIEMRLNWEILRERVGNVTNDFLYYEHGTPIGFLALYSFHSQEAEMSGMVHPDYRRQGIFRLLYTVAAEECKKRNIPKLVLFCDHASRSGKAFAEAMGAHYRSSEYKMELREIKKPHLSPLSQRLHIRRAQLEDVPTIARITTRAFRMDDSELATALERDLSGSNRRIYVGELDGEPVGVINVLIPGDEAFIYGFSVLPEHQGQGYGRSMLSWTVATLLDEKPRRIMLEVAPENDNALSLYRSCGFKETRTFDYYEIAVT
ncbi:MAG: GNAT family N-acetyltransferase [Ktedonobacteraceae bacterium]|nr:GNAT family N-acetyltransferase [Ktedonobacteraceae bacterium]